VRLVCVCRFLLTIRTNLYLLGKQAAWHRAFVPLRKPACHRNRLISFLFCDIVYFPQLSLTCAYKLFALLWCRTWRFVHRLKCCRTMSSSRNFITPSCAGVTRTMLRVLSFFWYWLHFWKHMLRWDHMHWVAVDVIASVHAKNAQKQHIANCGTVIRG